MSVFYKTNPSVASNALQRWIYRLLAPVALLASTTLLAYYYLVKRPNILVGQVQQSICIPPGMSFHELRHTLHQEGYLGNGFSFRLLAHLMRYDRQIGPGVYTLQPNMSNWQALSLLRSRAQSPVKVTLHNLRTQADLAEKITKNLCLSADDFKQLLCDAAFLGPYGFHPDNVLAMFIPNTYEVYWTITPQALFHRMYVEYKKFWNSERLARAQQLRLSPIEVTILASLVHQETNKISEAPIIAGVYINRLKRGMRLQSCVTLIHLVDDPTVTRVLNKHQQIDSPYNTYLYTGLPPGPIVIPSIAMIDAVLNYQKHNYLYFSAKADFSGYHHFSTHFREHNRKGKHYREALNRAGIYR